MFSFLGAGGNIWLALLSYLGKFMISAAFQAVFIITGEIYSTEIRSLVIGEASFSSRIGGITSPYINSLLVRITKPNLSASYATPNELLLRQADTFSDKKNNAREIKTYLERIDMEYIIAWKVGDLPEKIYFANSLNFLLIELIYYKATHTDQPQGKHHTYIPSGFFAMFSMVATILACLLPQTKDMSLDRKDEKRDCNATEMTRPDPEWGCIPMRKMEIL